MKKNVIQKIFVTNKRIYFGQNRKKIKNLAQKIEVKKIVKRIILSKNI